MGGMNQMGAMGGMNSGGMGAMGGMNAGGVGGFQQQ
tara:strand:+ start:1289 stop:1396 length:108 start_codon:yes stop_codon:yes gene_type:complete